MKPKVKYYWFIVLKIAMEDYLLRLSSLLVWAQRPRNGLSSCFGKWSRQLVFREAYQQPLKIRNGIRVEYLKNKSCPKRARKIVTPVWILETVMRNWGLGPGAMV